MRKLYLSTLAVSAIVLGATAANATFTGATVNYQYYYPNVSSPYSGAANGNYVVGPGVEISDVAAGHATMDISAANIYIDFLDGPDTWTASSYNGWILSDTSNNLATILGVTIDPATNMAGFSLSNVSFDADSISINWAGLSFDPNTVVSLNVVFADSAVPEPSTWAMMLLGFGSIGVALRRRRRKVLATG